ncbi:MAG: hypothetical protein U1F57_03655 [bacterium]
MLRLFFNRNSLWVKAAFWGGAFLTFLFFYQGRFSPLPILPKIFFLLFLLQILFAKAVDLYPWYPKGALGPGIALQFQKAIVPGLLYLDLLGGRPWKASTFLLILLNLFLLPMGAVACILIHFHRKDPDPSQPNILSGREKTGKSPANLGGRRLRKLLNLLG